MVEAQYKEAVVQEVARVGESNPDQRRDGPKKENREEDMNDKLGN